MIQNYDLEKQSISDMLKTLSKDCEAVFYSSDTSLKADTVQTQYDQAAQIELLLSQCDEERRVRRQTLQEIKEKNQMLDEIMLHISKLRILQKYTVIRTLIKGKDLATVASELNRSIETVKRHKQAGIDRIYYQITKRMTRHDP